MKKIVLITGSCGLVGASCSEFFSKKGFKIIGIDNNTRERLFGKLGSINKIKYYLKEKISDYTHFDLDICDEKNIEDLFKEYKFDLIIHAAAQPSHDWAKKYPLFDFKINAYGTLILLENFRKYNSQAVFIFLSTNKVYGDKVNYLPFVELEKRFDLLPSHPYYKGVDEKMGVDNTLHSLFGASKLSADILVQEYGKYYGLKTACFRCGCISGKFHCGVELHGFLSYLVRCFILNKKYVIYGYKGKQVRDNLHAYDLAKAFYLFYLNPKYGEIYNLGGGRFSNVSVLEAISICEKICGKKIEIEYKDENRIGDHIWWITDNSKFKKDFPDWELTYNVEKIIEEIYLFQKNNF